MERWFNIVGFFVMVGGMVYALLTPTTLSGNVWMFIACALSATMFAEHGAKAMKKS